MATAKRSKAGRSSRASAAAPASSRTSGSFSAGSSPVMQWFQNPAVRYVAGGIATAFLAKIATSMSGRYPQISQLLRDGLESVEGKLADFNGGSASSDRSEESSSTPMTSTRSRRSANANLATH